MLRIKPILFSALIASVLLSPALSLADDVNSWGGGSGTFDSNAAAQQRAAAAKRKAKKEKAAEEKKAAEAKKAEEAQTEKAGPVN